MTYGSSPVMPRRTDPQVTVVQNNQANLVDAATIQPVVLIGVTPEVDLQLQQDAIGARRETTAAAQALLCGGRKAFAAAKEALRLEGRQVVAAEESPAT